MNEPFSSRKIDASLEKLQQIYHKALFTHLPELHIIGPVRLIVSALPNYQVDFVISLERSAEEIGRFSLRKVALKQTIVEEWYCNFYYDIGWRDYWLKTNRDIGEELVKNTSGRPGRPPTPVEEGGAILDQLAQEEASGGLLHKDVYQKYLKITGHKGDYDDKKRVEVAVKRRVEKIKSIKNTNNDKISVTAKENASLEELIHFQVIEKISIKPPAEKNGKTGVEITAKG